LSNEFGPKDINPGWRPSTFAVSGDVSVGLVAAISGTVQIVPTFGVAMSRANVKVEYPTRDVPAYRLSGSDTLGHIDLGVGRVVDERFSIAPGVAILLGTEEHLGSAFRMTVGLNPIR